MHIFANAPRFVLTRFFFDLNMNSSSSIIPSLYYAHKENDVSMLFKCADYVGDKPGNELIRVIADDSYRLSLRLFYFYFMSIGG